MKKLGIGLLGAAVIGVFVWAMAVDNTVQSATPAMAAVKEACTRFQNLNNYRATTRYIDWVPEAPIDEVYDITVVDNRMAYETTDNYSVIYDFDEGQEYIKRKEGWMKRDTRVVPKEFVLPINRRDICPDPEKLDPLLWDYRYGCSRISTTVIHRGIDTSGDFEGQGLVRRYDVRRSDVTQYNARCRRQGVFGRDRWSTYEHRLWINNLGWLVQSDVLRDDWDRREKGQGPTHYRHVISHRGFAGRIELPKEWTQGSWPKGLP